MWLRGFASFLPVQGIAHLYGNQDGQSHGHRVRGLKNQTLDPSELGLVLTALQIVGLWVTQSELIRFLTVSFLFWFFKLSP